MGEMEEGGTRASLEELTVSTGTSKPPRHRPPPESYSFSSSSGAPLSEKRKKRDEGEDREAPLEKRIKLHDNDRENSANEEVAQSQSMDNSVTTAKLSPVLPPVLPLPAALMSASTHVRESSFQPSVVAESNLLDQQHHTSATPIVEKEFLIDHSPHVVDHPPSQSSKAVQHLNDREFGPNILSVSSFSPSTQTPLSSSCAVVIEKESISPPQDIMREKRTSTAVVCISGLPNACSEALLIDLFQSFHGYVNLTYDPVRCCCSVEMTTENDAVALLRYMKSPGIRMNKASIPLVGKLACQKNTMDHLMCDESINASAMRKIIQKLEHVDSLEYIEKVVDKMLTVDMTLLSPYRDKVVHLLFPHRKRNATKLGDKVSLLIDKLLLQDFTAAIVIDGISSKYSRELMKEMFQSFRGFMKVRLRSGLCFILMDSVSNASALLSHLKSPGIRMERNSPPLVGRLVRRDSDAQYGISSLSESTNSLLQSGTPSLLTPTDTECTGSVSQKEIAGGVSSTTVTTESTLSLISQTTQDSIGLGATSVKPQSVLNNTSYGTIAQSNNSCRSKNQPCRDLVNISKSTQQLTGRVSNEPEIGSNYSDASGFPQPPLPSFPQPTGVGFSDESSSTNIAIEELPSSRECSEELLIDMFQSFNGFQKLVYQPKQRRCILTMRTKDDAFALLTHLITPGIRMTKESAPLIGRIEEYHSSKQDDRVDVESLVHQLNNIKTLGELQHIVDQLLKLNNTTLTAHRAILYKALKPYKCIRCSKRISKKVKRLLNTFKKRAPVVNVLVSGFGQKYSTEIVTEMFHSFKGFIDIQFQNKMSCYVRFDNVENAEVFVTHLDHPGIKMTPQSSPLTGKIVKKRDRSAEEKMSDNNNVSLERSDDSKKKSKRGDQLGGHSHDGGGDQQVSSTTENWMSIAVSDFLKGSTTLDV